MPDHATSTDPAVQAQLDRLWRLSPGADILGLGRITQLLALLGDPHRRLPPVFHVAGTNGKGSTCAFLRAALEAAGCCVHAYTSPHLVRFNERIRLAGRLIEDSPLASLLAEVLDAAEAGNIGASFFEITTAAAFLAFARTPADACIVEVGLGGRLDATNVLPAPAVCGIAALGIDHQAFLGDTIEAIAGEKAGIARAGVPLVTLAHPPVAAKRVAATANTVGAPLLVQNTAWSIAADGDTLAYRDAQGSLALPRPALAGAHQADNYGLAVAMLRHQRALGVPLAALAAAHAARWPARMQRLGNGPLTARLPAVARAAGVRLDGAHNEQAAAAIAASWPFDAPATLVLGMLANKDADAVLRHLVGQGRIRGVLGVPVPGHDHHAPASLASRALALGADWSAPADSIQHAFDLLRTRDETGPVLVAGSLYLAGLVLAANEDAPD